MKIKREDLVIGEYYVYNISDDFSFPRNYIILRFGGNLKEKVNCTISRYGNYCNNTSCCHSATYFDKATPEQIEELLQKEREAGYNNPVPKELIYEIF